MMMTRKTFLRIHIYGTLLAVVLPFFYGYTVATFDEAVSLAFSSIKGRDIKKMSDLLASSVSLSVKGEEGVYTKFQVELLIDEFFRNNRVDEIKEIQRSNNSSSAFAVFSIKSGRDTYRVFMKFSMKEKAVKISEFRIE